MTPQKMSRLSDGCDLYGDAKHKQPTLQLRALCHANAPLRLTYQRTGSNHKTVEINCCIPGCDRHVATFAMSEVLHPEVGAEVPSPTCDLCGDNAAKLFHAALIHHIFTAPFRLESHKMSSGQWVLNARCYSETCNHLFAVLALEDGEMS